MLHLLADRRREQIKVPNGMGWMANTFPFPSVVPYALGASFDKPANRSGVGSGCPRNCYGPSPKAVLLHHPAETAPVVADPHLHPTFKLPSRTVP